MNCSQERHFTVSEIAKMWGLSRDTVTRLFAHEIGVFKLKRPETVYKRKHTTLRIPESVVIRVHSRMRACKKARNRA